jgi:Lar family restriction alleviation protein
MTDDDVDTSDIPEVGLEFFKRGRVKGPWQPCPFCGGRDVSASVHRPSSVICGDCGGSGPVASRPRTAIDAWNRRAEAAL